MKHLRAFVVVAVPLAIAVACGGKGGGGGDGGPPAETTPVPNPNITTTPVEPQVNFRHLLPLQDIKSISAGSHHVCALSNAGTVKCWGSGEAGQIGVGSDWLKQSAESDKTGLIRHQSFIAAMPVKDLGGDIKMISSGEDFSCALSSSGALQCWGSDDHGQLGDGKSGDNEKSYQPVSAPSLALGASSVFAGSDYTCAIVSGGAQCWGTLLGTFLKQFSPASLNPDFSSGLTSIASGAGHICALVNGGVQCLGDNTDGQSGSVEVNGSVTTPSYFHQPNPIEGLTSGVAAIVASITTTCALLDSGAVKCWGDLYGSDGNSASPTVVEGLESGVTAISIGAHHGCAIVNGGVKCWGRNDDLGQLGNASSDDSAKAVSVTGLDSGVSDIAVGDNSSCAVVKGFVKCWGNNQSGMLGNGTLENVPRGTVVDVLTAE